MDRTMLIVQALECVIILWSDGSLALVFEPGKGVHWVRIGNHPPPELVRTINSALTLMEAGAKDPAISKQCTALAEKLITEHEPELRSYLETRTTARK